MIFVNPDCYHGFRFPSLGMLSIAANLRAHGLPAHYVDCNFEPDWKQRLAALVREDSLIGITANILSIKPALELSRHIRAAHPDARIVMGGPYPTVEYEKLIPEAADIVVLGEGEDIAARLARGDSLEEIPSIAFRANGGVAANPRTGLIMDLDALPFPAWDLGTIPRYRLPHTRKNPVLPVMTSRGCPFNCIFCGSDIINGNRIRYRSVDSVLAEIDRMVNGYGVREIQFWDDNFTLNKNRAMELCKGIIRAGHKGLCLSIPSGIKPDHGDDELFRTMARAGFYFVCIAVESGSQEVMSQLGKKVDVSKVRETIQSVRRAGILTNGFFMIGLPFDTRETMEQTIAFARSLPLHQALFFITIPFPGTDLHRLVTEKGRFLYSDEQQLYEDGYFMGRASYEMPGRFDAALVEAMYKKAYRSFFLQPGRLAALALKRIRSPKDIYYLMIKGLKVLFKGRQF